MSNRENNAGENRNIPESSTARTMDNQENIISNFKGNFLSLLHEKDFVDAFRAAFNPNVNCQLRNSSPNSNSNSLLHQRASESCVGRPISKRETEMKRLFRKSEEPKFKFNKTTPNANNRKRKANDKGDYFLKQVVLIPDPMTNKIPEKLQKLRLRRKGFVIDAMKFDKTWTEKEVEEAIITQFPVLKNSIKFDLLFATDKQLDQIKICKGETLNGSYIHYIWKQKIMYVRPTSLISESSSDSSDFDLPDIKDALGSKPDYSGAMKSSNENLDHFTFFYDSDIFSNEKGKLEDQHGCFSKKESTDVSEVQKLKHQNSPQDLELHKNAETEKSCPILESTENCNLTFYETCLSELQYLNNSEDAKECQAPDISTPVEIPDKVTLPGILKQLSSKINHDEVSKFNINRESVLKSSIRAFERTNFRPENKIDVVFMDAINTPEGAIDDGGPRREFLRLLVKGFVTSHLFSGPDKSRNLTLNAAAVDDGWYFHAGQAISLSLVHGGSGPRCFSKLMYDSLIVADLQKLTPTLEDIDDYDLRTTLEAILKYSSYEEVQRLATEISNILIAAGITNFVPKYEERGQFVERLMRFWVVNRVSEARLQFMKGLRKLGVYFKMIVHPEVFESEFCFSDCKITSDLFLALFKKNVEYSEGNKYKAELETMCLFSDYVLGCELGETEVSVPQLMIFATGTDSIPPMGFDVEPSIGFLHGESNNISKEQYPKANTCALKLYLPTMHQTYKEFVKNMDFGILSANDFGFA